MTTKQLPVGATILATFPGSLRLHAEVLAHDGETVKFKTPNGELTCWHSDVIKELENGEAEFVFDKFTQGYLTCALWSSNDNSDDTGGAPLDDNYGIEDLTVDALIDSIEDCVAFQRDNETLLAAYYQLLDRNGHPESAQEFAGHDFWLTRNGHGAGFWDRGLGKLGDALSEAAKTYSGVDITVGGDGKLYI